MSPNLRKSFELGSRKNETYSSSQLALCHLDRWKNTIRNHLEIITSSIEKLVYLRLMHDPHSPFE